MTDTALDPATRPRAPRRPGDAATPVGRQGQETLVGIHDHLRAELARIGEAVEEVAGGHVDVGAARSLVHRLTARQNGWSLGGFCAAYCRVVALHYTIEDEHLFTGLRRADPALGPVLDRLGAEHEVIAGILDRLDRALVALVAADGDDAALAEVGVEVDALTAALGSHLAYEEEELLPSIGRLSIVV